MTTQHPFDPAHDDAIRSVLLDTVHETARPKPSHRVAWFASIAAACLLAIGGGGYAYASLHQTPGTGGSAAVQPTPTRAATPSAPSSAVPAPSNSSSATPPGNVEPASTPSPTPLPVPVTAANIKTPVILTPTEGEVFRQKNTDITFSGTGTPGTNIYLVLDVTVPGQSSPDPIPQTLGQPGQTPIVVGADGRWSYRQAYPGGPDAALQSTVVASAALVGADGNTQRDSTGALIQTGQSATRTYVQGPAS